MLDVGRLTSSNCIAILATKYSIERPKIDIRLVFSSSARMTIAIVAVALAVLIIAAIVMPPLREILGWVTVVSSGRCMVFGTASTR